MRKAEPPVLDMFAAVGNDSVFHLIHWHSYIYSTFPDVKSTQENSCYPTPKTKVIPQLIKYGCEEKCTKMVVNVASTVLFAQICAPRMIQIGKAEAVQYIYLMRKTTFKS